jgi:hypothetical protein
MSNLADPEEAVFSIDDLRGYIFSFIRKEPRVNVVNVMMYVFGKVG